MGWKKAEKLEARLGLYFKSPYPTLTQGEKGVMRMSIYWGTTGAQVLDPMCIIHFFSYTNLMD